MYFVAAVLLSVLILICFAMYNYIFDFNSFFLTFRVQNLHVEEINESRKIFVNIDYATHFIVCNLIALLFDYVICKIGCGILSGFCVISAYKMR
jgi:hypothetical protein